MFNIPSFFGFRAGGSVPLLLNEFPGAAAAYSLRLLDSTYLGDAIQVRESTNNTTLDIGFVNGELDTASLLAHCAGANGFVTEWYDQSGNANNATQGLALNQPQIVSSGSVILENGKPCVQFDGIDDVLNSSTVALKWIVSALNPLTAANTYESFIAYNNRHILLRFQSGTTLLTTGSQLFQPTPTRTFVNNIETANFTNSIMQLFAVGSDTVFSTNQFIVIGDDNAGGRPASQKISEVIAFTDNQEFTNKNGISANINSFYSIF